MGKRSWNMIMCFYKWTPGGENTRKVFLPYKISDSSKLLPCCQSKIWFCETTAAYLGWKWRQASEWYESRPPPASMGGSPLPCLGLATHHWIAHARHTQHTAALATAVNQAAPRRFGLTGVQMAASFRRRTVREPLFPLCASVWNSVYVLTALLCSLLGERLLVLVGEPSQYGLSSSSASCRAAKTKRGKQKSCTMLA